MGSRKSNAGSAAPAVLLAIVILLLVGSTLYFHIAKTWWFPPAITPVGHEIDRQFFLTLVVTGIVFVLAQLALAWMVFKYRDHGQKARFTRGNHVLEVVWTTATLVIFVGLGALASHAWGQVHFAGIEPGAVQVEVTGVQFTWTFRYPGPDGKFGKIVPADIDASVGNPLGLDPNDPAGKDDIVVPTLTASLSSANITSQQELTVKAAVKVPSGDPTPTGSVKLTSGPFTTAAKLTAGRATIPVAPGSFNAGHDTVTIAYAPDAESSTIYKSATVKKSITVNRLTPTVAVKSSSTITTVQTFPLSVTVSAGQGDAAPTGTVVGAVGSLIQRRSSKIAWALAGYFTSRYCRSVRFWSSLPPPPPNSRANMLPIAIVSSGFQGGGRYGPESPSTLPANQNS